MELLNACCDSENPLRPRVANYVSLLRKPSEIAIYPLTSQLFDIMQEQQLTAALALDRHFVQAGFDALLR